MKTAESKFTGPATLGFLALAMLLAAVGSPARAQFGGLGGVGGALKKAQTAKEAFDELNITDAEERQIGEDVSLKIRRRFGVVQDPAVHKYVSLVGTTLAKVSDRPGLAWTFIVLDTDGGGERRLRGGASRLSVLRTAASRAETVAAWLPEAPGPHRLLAVIRARLAEMDGRGELWELAIAEANRGYELDPADPYLAELLWTLHLRAGDWAEAEAWQARVEAAARAMSEGVEGHGGAGPGGKGGSGVE